MPISKIEKRRKKSIKGKTFCKILPISIIYLFTRMTTRAEHKTTEHYLGKTGNMQCLWLSFVTVKTIHVTVQWVETNLFKVGFPSTSFTQWTEDSCRTKILNKIQIYENFRLNRDAMIFWVKQLINPYFHMNIPCDRIFFLVLNLFTFTFDLFLNKIDIGHQSFHIACEPSLEFPIIMGNCVSQTHFVWP